MDNNLSFCAEILKVLFTKVSTKNVLNIEGLSKSYSKLNKHELFRLLRTELPQYNDNELSCRINSFWDELLLNSTYFINDDEISIFDILFSFVEKIIDNVNYKFVFRYIFANIWRNTILQVDEEIFVAAAAAQYDVKNRINRSSFEWEFCIEHDNTRLNTILNRERGVSENHFHLRGSSPYFHISWILLMNRVTEIEYKKYMKILDYRHLKEQKQSSIFDTESSFLLLYLKAAAIRLYLFSVITETPITFGEYYISTEKIYYDILSEDISTVDLDRLATKISGTYIRWNDFIKENKKIKLKDALSIYSINEIIYKKYISYCQKENYLILKSMLLCKESQYFPEHLLQDAINRLHFLFNPSSHIDYSQNFKNNILRSYIELSGERFILYNSIKTIYEQGKNKEKIEFLLYVYLLIKNKIRCELVQSNPLIGFGNFKKFQDRKDWFIPWSDKTEKQLATATIQSLLEGPLLFRAELRISPSNSWVENVKKIRLYDQAIYEAIMNHRLRTKVEKEQFFYTFHFIKMKDEENQSLVCRDYRLRKKIEIQADSIIALRKNALNTARRVLGIDACGYEMDCRPEVFGSVFRRLQYYNEPEINSNCCSHPLNQIRATYHVGEDNYDIVDALRAIYEAILFLELKAGSRLGHATLLGISPEFYYKKRNYYVSMPCQVFLDNIVWLYFFINDNSIRCEGVEGLMKYLEEQFDLYFKKIYLNNIDLEHLKIIHQEASKNYRNLPKQIYDVYCDKTQYEFNIYRYYESYLLRGDSPELYSRGYYKPITIFDRFKISNSHKKMNGARYTVESVYLYFLYHFNGNVRNLGNQSITKEISIDFINAVKEVQKTMKQKIVELGLSIETNPSSNVLISPINDYSQHPIVNFYDKEFSNKTIGHLQLNVSINTDDKGVFSTCLSNEYAYLLFYLENQKKSTDEYVYSPVDLYDWIDSIRRMGNEQSFGNQ